MSCLLSVAAYSVAHNEHFLRHGPMRGVDPLRKLILALDRALPAIGNDGGSGGGSPVPTMDARAIRPGGGERMPQLSLMSVETRMLFLEEARAMC